MLICEKCHNLFCHMYKEVFGGKYIITVNHTVVWGTYA